MQVLENAQLQVVKAARDRLERDHREPFAFPAFCLHLLPRGLERGQRFAGGARLVEIAAGLGVGHQRQPLPRCLERAAAFGKGDHRVVGLSDAAFHPVPRRHLQKARAHLIFGCPVDARVRGHELLERGGLIDIGHAHERLQPIDAHIEQCQTLHPLGRQYRGLDAGTAAVAVARQNGLRYVQRVHQVQQQLPQRDRVVAAGGGPAAAAAFSGSGTSFSYNNNTLCDQARPMLYMYVSS